jgi:CCR4-NOT transcription complex subunit 4
LSALVSSPTSPSPPLALSSSDFPALVAEHSQSVVADDTTASTDNKTQRKLAKKAVAFEKAAERLKASQEKAAAKAAEKARIAAEKSERKESAGPGQGQQESGQQEKAPQDATQREKLEQGSLRQEKPQREKAAQEKLHRENVMQEKVEQERVESDRSAEEKVIAKRGKPEKERTMQVEKDKEKGAETKKGKQNSKAANSPPAPKVSATPTVPEPVPQVPLLSKKPKKVKTTSKPTRIPKEEDPVQEEAVVLSPVPVQDPGPTAVKAPTTTTSSSVNSRAGSVERNSSFELAPLEELFEEIDVQNAHMDLPNHPFFDIQKLNPSAKLPLEYGPLVHALSALSIGGGSFANNMPSGSIDNAVSSFQQLLETLTQTVSDLLRLLPRTTWDDSSSFDGVLREMLKGDDFLDDGGDDGSAKEDEVAALTLALERRARWMEVQLSKLEELHRDINVAAVRAVFTFNDNGWDQSAYLPRVGNTLRRFDSIGAISDGKEGTRPMTADELEKKLAVAKEAANFAEMEVKELMKKMQMIRPVVVEF